MRQERVSSLKHSCPDEEWEEILVSLFSQQTPEGVQATAKVEEGRDADDPPSHLIIEVRRSVQGITVSVYIPLYLLGPRPLTPTVRQKHLGDVTLRYEEEEPIDVVEWCSTSVLAHEESRAFLSREKDRVAKLTKEVEDLQTQLNAFIDAKKTDEAGLREQVRDLLNETKVKIREQQRLLSSAPRARSPRDEREMAASEGVSPDIKVEDDARGHAPVASRRSKRKTVTPKEESSDDEFERMEVDEPKEGPARDSDDNRTTDAGSDDDATASEDEDEESPIARAVTTQSKQPMKGKKGGNEAPPPKRELPFATRRCAKATPPPKGAESETESDDEL